MTQTKPWVSACFLASTSLTPDQISNFKSHQRSLSICLLNSNWSTEIYLGVWEVDWILTMLNENKESRLDCEIHAIAKAQAFSFW